MKVWAARSLFYTSILNICNIIGKLNHLTPYSRMGTACKDTEFKKGIKNMNKGGKCLPEYWILVMVEHSLCVIFLMR